MNDTRPSRRRGGGLPDDDDDGVLSALAAAAFSSPPPRTTLAAVPASPEPAAQEFPPAAAAAPASPAPPAAPAAVAPPVRSAAVSAPPAQDSDDEPAHEGTADFIRQSTVQVDADTARRFRRYQERQRPRPSNAEVIFRALDETRDRYPEIVEARRPQLPEGRRFGRPVPGRRPAGSRLATQINFRPTVGEETEIKALAKQAGAASMSAFVDAVLDEFLPR